MAKLPAPGGDPRTYANHSGIDFLRGSPWYRKAFYASGPGRVVRLSRNSAGGNWVVVKYDAFPREVGYAHMDNHNGCPRPGTRVGLGTRLGYVGRTGARVTGPHIHVEILGVGTDSAVWGYFNRTPTVQQVMAGGGGSSSGELVVDGKLGPATVRSLQKALGAKVDGIWGSGTTTALQKKLVAAGHKIAVDGRFGPATIKAMQIFILGAKHADGKMGPQTIRGLQSYLNSGGKFVVNKPKPTPKPKPKPSSKGTLHGLRWTGVQRMLKKDFGYTGAIDNIPGLGTIKAFQRFMNAKDYGNLKVDGIDGIETLKAAQTWLKRRWGYAGKIDGIRGSGTNAAWARAEAANGRAYS